MVAMAANLHLNYPTCFSQPSSGIVPSVRIVGSFFKNFLKALPSAKPFFVLLWSQLLAQPSHPGTLHKLLILSINGKGKQEEYKAELQSSSYSAC